MKRTFKAGKNAGSSFSTLFQAKNIGISSKVYGKKDKKKKTTTELLAL